MKIFREREVREAMAYAKEGGQALHIHRFTADHFLFKRYPEAAHLFDQNLLRLIMTAKKLGVKVIKVEHQFEPKQHIDLVAGPLERAKLLAGDDK